MLKHTQASNKMNSGGAFIEAMWTTVLPCSYWMSKSVRVQDGSMR